MIQRIQTIFLLVSSLLISVLFFVPLIGFNTPVAEFILSADKFIQVGVAESIGVEWPVLITVSIMFLMPFVTIFLYKQMLLQIRFCVFSSILNILFYALYFYEAYTVSDKIVGEYTVMIIPMVIPALSIVFNLLAQKRILMDHLLIKSLDRIR